jgi:multidrug efflux pump subunit AcrB/ABC-type multidrug transport system ATPase subunit
MGFGKFVIGRKISIVMIFIGLTLMGMVSYHFLPVELLPNAELPFLIVHAFPYYGEVDPEYMEREVIIPLEGAVSMCEGIDEIESYAGRRRGRIFAYYQQGTSMKHAYLKLQENINSAKSSIPENFNVIVTKLDTESLTNIFMGLQVLGSGGVDRVRQMVEREVVKKLESIDGVASVEVLGGREKAVSVVLDKQASEAYGITPAGINNLIVSSGESNTFVGQTVEGQRRRFVNVVAEYTDIKELENITVSDEGPVLLGDVADVSFGVREEESLSRVNGKDAVTVQLTRESQVNLIELSGTVRSVVDELNRELKGQDIEVLVQYDSAESIRDNVNMVIRLAIIGAILAILVLWMFLRNLRLVVVVALAIPISVFTALNFFYAAGITINTLTLVGMALAVGMLLDNSVVVLENIYRLISRGKRAIDAISQGVREVWRSVTAATATTIIVFLPFIFSSAFVIKLTGRHVGVSIISTLMVSLLVALVLIPMITGFFLRKGKKSGQARFRVLSGRNRLVQMYTALLKTALRHPARTAVGAVVVFFISLFICLALSRSVTEEAEQSYFKLYVTMSSGATLEKTDATVKELEKLVQDIPHVESRIAEIREEDADITFRLKDDYQEIDGRTMAEVKELAKRKVKDFSAADLSFDEPQSTARYGGSRRGGEERMFRMFGIGSQREKVVIKGNDFEVMRKVAADIEYYLEELSSVERASMNISDDSPEIHLHLDNQLLRTYDISMSNIASELNSFQPETESRLSFKQDNQEYAIVVKITEDGEYEDKTVDDLRELPIKGRNGSIFQLEELGDIVYSYGMPGIHRINQEKEIEVAYSFQSEVNDSRSLLDAARAEVDGMVSQLNIPAGVAVEVVHDETDYSEYIFLISVAFILIYIILASVFESFHAPVIIMFTIPLAAVGSLWALIFTGTSVLNMYSLIGMLILLGVVVNNGIILIDYTLILRRRGYRRTRAIMEAGRARVRPILITAITTIFAMIPLAMGKESEAGLIGSPFAITVIGGLSLSTLFTLVFVPVVYSGLENVIRWFRDLDWKIKAAQLILFATFCILIYIQVDSLIWKMIYVYACLKLIPGLTYLAMNSLRRAREEFIGKDEQIKIRLRNIVKIYDQQSRFIREWNKGRRIAEGRLYLKADRFIWQMPFLGFLIYFVYFYLNNQFWLFVLSHAVFFYIIYVWEPVGGWLKGVCEERLKWSVARYTRLAERIFKWGFPLFNLVLFQLRWDNLAVVIFIAILWYAALTVYTVSDRLHRDKVNVERIEGRFASLRRSIYRLIKMVPVIGKKKQPFRALGGVSVEIGRGMFGLLGPNGAGKTTLMRIICGILQQSYGRVWINDLDVNEYREELQGLIGYLPQEFGAYENMKAWDFLDYQAILKGVSEKQKREKLVDYVLSAVHMQEYRNKKIGSFSGGMKQRMGIAQILLHLPRILVVDEPTAGLDPRERIRFRNLLVELSRERVVIFSTHIIEDISSSCNRVAVLNEGKLCFLGEPAGMTGMADGVVWQFLVEPSELTELKKEMIVVHHMKLGDRIRVRCLCREKPARSAESVTPTLEDSYIWMLKMAGGVVR